VGTCFHIAESRKTTKVIEPNHHPTNERITGSRKPKTVALKCLIIMEYAKKMRIEKKQYFCAGNNSYENDEKDSK
jgi:hypothetical protein